MKTLVCVNILDNVNAQVYGSHCQEWFRLGRSTSDDFILFHPNRLSIDNARNQAADLALRMECDYLFFLDDDMILSANTYKSLKACGADIVQALTFVRSYPFRAMMFKKGPEPGLLDFYDDYEKDIKSDGTVDCEAVGFSCALLDVSKLRMVNKPYFITSVDTTEDVFYCLKLRNKLGNDAKILVDTKCPTGHMLHPEFLTKSNVEDFRQRYAALMPDSKDRGGEYLKQCKTQLKNLH
jgi:hypothetical protein